MNIFDIFKKVKTEPLPKYPPIKIEEIPAASGILFYGGNKLTELAGNRLYKFKYRPPAFHAAFYIGDPEPGMFLNVGKFKTIQDISAEFRSTRRIDIIIYKNIDVDQRRRLAKLAIMDASKPKVGVSLPDYGITDYLRFGLRFLRPSKKDFCSENVCELLAAESVIVSSNKPVDTAPWDLQEFAEANPESCEIRTLWIGPDFKK